MSGLDRLHGPIVFIWWAYLQDRAVGESCRAPQSLQLGCSFDTVGLVSARRCAKHCGEEPMIPRLNIIVDLLLAVNQPLHGVPIVAYDKTIGD